MDDRVQTAVDSTCDFQVIGKLQLFVCHANFNNLIDTLVRRNVYAVLFRYALAQEPKQEVVST